MRDPRESPRTLRCPRLLAGHETLEQIGACRPRRRGRTASRVGRARARGASRGCNIAASGTMEPVSTTTTAPIRARATARGRWSETDGSGTTTAGTRDRRRAATVLYPPRLIDSEAPSSQAPKSPANSWTTTRCPGRGLAAARITARSAGVARAGAKTWSGIAGIASEATSVPNASATATRNSVASSPPALATAHCPSGRPSLVPTGSTTMPVERTGAVMRSAAENCSGNVARRGSAWINTASKRASRSSTSSS